MSSQYPQPTPTGPLRPRALTAVCTIQLTIGIVGLADGIALLARLAPDLSLIFHPDGNDLGARIGMFLLAMAALAIVVPLPVIVFTALIMQGRRWARTAYTVTAALSILIVAAWPGTDIIVLRLIQVLLTIVCVAVMFSRSSSAYFAACTAEAHPQATATGWRSSRR